MAIDHTLTAQHVISLFNVDESAPILSIYRAPICPQLLGRLL
ncbi:hypothetical protein M486_2665 [Yersinia pestis 1045]|uniref:Uncharacterized protein n=5 Tax=Yersinia pseudotuberculosis complex TaxID=1649845 RepID=A0AAX2HZM7_YERPE|nr:hypothetical protein A1122_20170 [Yersinia pestis A1122]AIN13285.1 hypothetical protein DJ40_944 [Yersinia pseudotuberculosis]AJI93020.1 hypothetical protein CH59_589 [Yersinia pestis]AJJ00732.1 hypothetical protein BZ18_3764 [Yersinia pestis Pestoides F]AJJ56635.1 hypothetical protein BZ17_1234 [Yersinia pseudotuberculosis IP 32953]AJJ60982.1 hypothetical protein BZ22_3345 [Yersinia pseudotuberculosis YPIII]AJJ66808.1 hypothetical protein BZ16_692 [Yersinia pseudotuberculosis PB1/+]AJJ79